MVETRTLGLDARESHEREANTHNKLIQCTDKYATPPLCDLSLPELGLASHRSVGGRSRVMEPRESKYSPNADAHIAWSSRYGSPHGATPGQAGCFALLPIQKHSQ